ncbi:synaptotagmin-like protein 2 isoform X1 [Ahaetulla prasina]|uniref:synaptotagmin-like protein 2 isoform X1 n=1 Tax=Ahaetulla prasina TaxID=499056 RepID=UPI0026498A18|nr:synaptotagmin-like protein 2 isoform X1 [Ahaetulla prasina]XP_058053105.1 synaptotagmin-like protein 2 isoform X1 [Ahaetulla prasina]
MLDLSFLTEEEYSKLMRVLQRDAELKKKDSDRIRRLQDSLRDEKKKKFVTGEWFHEAKAQRFREDLEGSDLLRASIRKKNSHSDGTDNELIPQIAEGGQAVLPTDVAVLSSPLSKEGRLCEPGSNCAERQLVKSKPRVKLSTRPSSLEKKSSVEDISPADSGIVVSPFAATRENSEVGFELSPGSSTKLLDEFSYSVGDCVTKVAEDIPDGVKELGGFQPALQREVNPPSRIPVNRKSSKPLFSPNFTNSDGAKKSGLGLEKTQVLKSFKFPPAGEENGPPLIPDANRIIISSVNTKDDEIGVDHAHFKNLKNFWEKGGESLLANDTVEKSVEKANPIAVNGRPSRLNQSLSAQSSQGQTSDDKLSSNMNTKTRIVCNRSVTLSSSEDEPVYTSPPRKGSGSYIPRSSYGRRKGSMGSRNHLSEGNGKQSSVEEERKVQRSTKRSKLPIWVPSVKIETPIKGQTGIIYEPEIPADEFVMIEENKRKMDSLAGRVQILIESVPSEEMDPEDDVVGRCPDLDNLETKEILHEAELCSFMEDLPENEVDDENQDTQEVDNYVPSEGEIPPAPVFKKIRRTNGCNLAKSMVNLYTTTETYTKPQVLSHQYLEPERAKELSRSSPFLLSETESDTASEISFQFNRPKKTSSVGSHSSDMASVSSVSGSVLSVYSGDFGSVDAQGLVQFALDYDEKNQEFQIFVSQCKDLAIVDEKKGRTDPYVKTYLLPDKARMGKRKTSVKKRTISPVYNEVLRYKIQKMVLLIQKLNLSVWHNDPLGRNSFLGEMEIDLASWDWRNNKLNWYMLKPRSLSAINGVDHRGVMNLSIKYVPPGSLAGRKNPPSGEVHIWVKDTKDLPQLRPSGVDSFVKCYVLPDTSKKSYQKTRIVKRDSNPVFNHTIVYDGFHTEDLKDACVELTVWDHEKLTNHFLGGIRLGLGTGFSYGIAVDWMDSTQEEVAFWQEMMSTPNEWIEGSLLLRSLAGKSKLK